MRLGAVSMPCIFPYTELRFETQNNRFSIDTRGLSDESRQSQVIVFQIVAVCLVEQFWPSWAMPRGSAAALLWSENRGPPVSTLSGIRS